MNLESNVSPSKNSCVEKGYWKDGERGKKSEIEGYWRERMGGKEERKV
jgi:hypothetical protein